MLFTETIAGFSEKDGKCVKAICRQNGEFLKDVPYWRKDTGEIEVKGRRGRRRKQLRDNVKEK